MRCLRRVLSGCVAGPVPVLTWLPVRVMYLFGAYLPSLLLFLRVYRDGSEEVADAVTHNAAESAGHRYVASHRRVPVVVGKPLTCQRGCAAVITSALQRCWMRFCQ